MKKKKMGSRSESDITRANAYLNLLKIALLLIQTILFMCVWFGFYQKNMLHPYYYWGNWVMGALFMTLYLTFVRLYGGLQINVLRTGEIFYSQMIGSFFNDFIFYCIICLLSYHLANPLPLVLCWGIGLLVSALWAYYAIRLNDYLFPPRRTYIVFDSEDAYGAMETIKGLTWKFQVVGSLNISMGIDRILTEIRHAEAVVLCDLRSSTRNIILKYCVECGIQTYIRPKIGDILVSSATRLHLGKLPFLCCASSNRSYWYRIAKRLMDVTISGIALVLSSPIFAVVAIAIHQCDGGPVFYRQCRLTEGGREFQILKFRSMRVDAESDGVARLAAKEDNRITPVGHLIRKFRLDELPQFINILRGEMSLVGPRPERPEIAAQYESSMPEFRLRLQVKAGLTGYAQVYGKYNTDPYDKLEMDLMYIAKPSILQDVALLFATVKILFLSESTEGVESEEFLTSPDGQSHLSV